MDHGPVDAGPSSEDLHDRTARSNSPETYRLEGPRVPNLYKSSMKRTDMGKESPTRVDDIVDVEQLKSSLESTTSHDHSQHRRMSGESVDSYRDAPRYPKVGATEAEMNGEVCEDEPDVHLKAPEVEEKRTVPDEQQLHRMFKFTLYETNARYWITGGDLPEKNFRLLRIDRTSMPGQITLFEDEMVYDRAQMNQVLTTIDEGNRATGGLRKKFSFWGLLGFIRFTEAYYMLIITKRQQVAIVGGHYVYQIESTELVALTTGASLRFVRDRNPQETRFLGILNSLDLSQSFYFSYSYDITHSLQHNIIRQRQALAAAEKQPQADFNAMFVWNHHLLKPAISALKHPFDWCLPIIHGYIDQAPLDIFGRSVYLTIIGRRSRFFAGARFLKRGVNDLGYVANDVETEQIVAEKLTTSFHAPGPRLFSNPTYTSYVQHRGSIPLYWTQDNSGVGVKAKPMININLPDPFFQPAALHFDNLFERYGCPVYVLNLVKAREKIKREGKLLSEFEDCIDYLNQSLPADKKILYKAYDMARASQNVHADVMGELAEIARDVVDKTGFFRNGETGRHQSRVQNGVARTNCIDCLDRTNSAQFVIGKRALALQLKALGVFEHDDISYDTDVVNMFTAMFHNHGDTMAIQYGSSHLVNTVNTYRRLNQWQNSTAHMMENMKRYYNNSFMDTQRQEAYNLFLGNYVWAQGQPMLWDLSTDYYLHHSDPKAWLERHRRNYIHWYTPEFLELRTMPEMPLDPPAKPLTSQDISEHDSYWMECYRPTAISSIVKVFPYRMASESRYLPEKPHRETKYHDFSPFTPRVNPRRNSIDSAEKRVPRKGVRIADPPDESPTGPDAAWSTHTKEMVHRRPTSADEMLLTPSILWDPTFERKTGRAELDKSHMHLWTLPQLHTHSLNPSVSDAETREYERYVARPLDPPLVVAAAVPPDAIRAYVDYVRRAGGPAFDDLDEPASAGVGERDLAHFRDFVRRREDPLTVTEDDGAQKRYKAYKQWLRGKSLFRQSKVDPEYESAHEGHFELRF